MAHPNARVFREHVIECRPRRLGPGASRSVGAVSEVLSGGYPCSIRESHRHRYAGGRAARNSPYHSGHDSLNYSAPRARQRRSDEDVHDIFLHHDYAENLALRDRRTQRAHSSNHLAPTATRPLHALS